MGKNTKANEKRKDNKNVGRYSEQQTLIGNQGWLFYDAPYKAARHIAKRMYGDNGIDLGGGTGIMASIISSVTDKNIRVYEGDLTKVDAKDGTYDTVYSSHVLEHVADPLAVVNESIRISKKRIIHVVPQGYTEDINLGTEHKYMFNRGNFMSLMYEAIKDKPNVQVVEFDVITDYHVNSLICVLLKD